MPKAWVHQDSKQVKKRGEAAASWYCSWLDPDGNRRTQSCGAGERGKRLARGVARKREGELAAGTYQSKDRITWEAFRAEYEEKIVNRKGIRSRTEILTALAHFQRIINPKRMTGIKTQTVDNFVARLRTEAGKKKGDKVSPATVNKDLRHLRAALKKAAKWGYLPRVPDFDFEKEPKKLPRFVTAEHFALMYQHCDGAKLPDDQPYAPADWWRALLVTGYMTGWRISELLALTRTDLDLEAGTAVTRAEDNKGGRDDQVKLHAVVVEHLQKLAGFDPGVFPWNHDRTTLMKEFRRVQEAAGIRLPCRGVHTHTPACYVYGFHDLRRAFATMNAAKLSADALQALMRHKSYATTQRYINMTSQLDEAVETLHVPEVLKAKGG